MHHTLRLYSRFQKPILKIYLLCAKLIKIPVFGHFVLWLANTYGIHEHSGYFLTYNEAKHIVKKAGVIALGPCSCRQVNNNCDTPVMTELLIANGADVFVETREKDVRLISVAEALDILDSCHQRKLIPTIQKCHGSYYAICNCCDCCCVPLILMRKYNVKTALVRDKKVIDEIKHDLAKNDTTPLSD